VHEVNRITAFVGGLLHLSERRSVRRKPVDVRTAVQQALEDTERLAHDSAVDIQVNMPATPLLAAGNETLLLHAIRNVIRNAIQALRGRPDPRHVAISLPVELHQRAGRRR
jgi:two-component system C4-dicarboxylate transport sensor histidine kinase DctB